MTFEIRADGVDVDEVLRQIRAAIEEKKSRPPTDEEIHEIASRPLRPVLQPHASEQPPCRLLAPPRWTPIRVDAIYRSSRGCAVRF